jgi:hypothetical protein
MGLLDDIDDIPADTAWGFATHVIVGALIGVFFAGTIAGFGVALELTAPAVDSIQTLKITPQLILWTVIGMIVSHRYLGIP